MKARPVPEEGVASVASTLPAGSRREVEGAPVFKSGHTVGLLKGGDALFPAMIEAMAGARHQIWLVTYIFHTDPEALRVVQALESAAARGVRVRVVIDGFGSLDTLSWLEPRLRRAGVSTVVFRPIRRWVNWLERGQLRRLHMKLCVVDGHTGFVGGINVLDDRLDLTHGRTALPRLDYAVRVTGPVVRVIDQTARALWSRAWLGQDWREEARTLVQEPSLLRRWRGVARSLRLPRAARWQGSREGDAVRAGEPVRAGVRAAFVLRDNFSRRRSIEHAYMQAIRSARHRIWLVSPYFYPGREFRRLLGEAAARGVDVRLLMQGKPDYRFAAASARVLYDELLAEGVRIFEYRPAFLHAKVMVVDTRWSTVGSSNIDPLSLLLNLEANVVIEDEAFTHTLAEDVGQALDQSDEITVEHVRQRGWASWVRRVFIGWAARGYLRLAGFTGRY